MGCYLSIVLYTCGIYRYAYGFKKKNCCTTQKYKRTVTLFNKTSYWNSIGAE